VPGADDDRLDRDDLGGSVPGEDGDLLDREDGFSGGSVPGADDDFFDAMLPFAPNAFEQPAVTSATVARAASDRSFLLMFLSCVW
jgi:hypothetical protein